MNTCVPASCRGADSEFCWRHPGGVQYRSRRSQTSGTDAKSRFAPWKGARGPPMGSTFHSLHFHVVFSTKERRPFIDSKWRNDLHAYLGGIVRGLGGIAEAVGGVEDHVHLLISLKTTDAPVNIIRELKKASSV